MAEEENVIIDVTPEEVADAASDNGAASDDTAPKALPKSTKKWPLISSLVVVLIIAGFAAGTIWGHGWAQMLGLQQAPATNTQQLNALSAELEALRQRLDASEARADDITANISEQITAPVQEPVDLTPLEEKLAAMDARLKGLESQFVLLIDNNSTDALKSRANSQQERLDAMADRLSALEARSGQQAAALDTINQDALAGLEQGVLALAVSRLQAAVESGGAFLAELNAVEQQIARQPSPSLSAIDAIRQLKTQAIDGVPTLAGLQAEAAGALEEIIVEPIAGPEPAEPGSWWEDAWSSLTDGISIRRLDEEPDATPVVSTPLDNFESVLAGGDVSAALEAMATLSAEQQEALNTWRGRAEQHLEAAMALPALQDAAAE
jgi:hypothetical protein